MSENLIPITISSTSSILILQRLEDENPTWTKIFREYPDWRVFLIKDKKILPSRHLEKEVVVLEEEIINTGGHDAEPAGPKSYKKKYKKKGKKSSTPFRAFASQTASERTKNKGFRIDGKKKRNDSSSRQFQFNDTLSAEATKNEPPFVENDKVEAKVDYAAKWATEKSRWGRTDSRIRARQMEHGNITAGSSSPGSTESPENDENDENSDRPTNLVDLEVEYRQEFTKNEISRFQLKNFRIQQRKRMSRVLRNKVNTNENGRTTFGHQSSTNMNSSSSTEFLCDAFLNSIDENFDLTEGFLDTDANNGNETDSDLLLFDPDTEKDTLNLLYQCFEECFGSSSK